MILPRLALAGSAVLVACTQPLRLTPDDSNIVLARTSIAAPNPGDRGSFTVGTLYYGSGTDRRRPAFRDSVTLKTPPVDASRMASPPPGLEKWYAKAWGFDMKKAPLNARVWYPEGQGPFPLVLVVHGNHAPLEYSDPGYAWLGEHLASRGFIVASIDENFLNGLSQESDARAWVLLKHLERWRGWNDSTSPFKGKVDMNNIALIGHSRGGESVAHAATFNRIARYPDDARVRFNFGFNIKSVIAIAPVDAQYRPANQLNPVENVNYLIVHGSHDGDVSAMAGIRQYQRVRFTDGKPWIKSAFYVYRANHGQWNTVWGTSDLGPARTPRQLDLRGLIDGDAQRQFARVVFGGFLEATLRGRREYLEMFRDHRTAGAWLPRTMYITRIQEHTFTSVANFEEDVDPTTGTAKGARMIGDSLSTWREGTIRFRTATWISTETTNNNGVWLGWNNRVAGKDTARRGQPARFTIQIPDSIGRGRENGSLVLALTPTRDVPRPRAEPGRPPPAATDRFPSDTTTPMDLTVELEDSEGHIARQPLSRYGTVRRPLEVAVFRRADRDRLSFPNSFELMLQTYVMPVSDFTRSASSFNASSLRSIRLVFDRTPSGTVILDDVGFSQQ